MTFAFACKTSALPKGKMTCATVNGKKLLLANVNGRISATQGICSHEYALLSDGNLEGKEVTCPLHSAVFDVETGKVIKDVFGSEQLMGLAKDLQTYEVKVEGDSVMVDC